MSVITNKIRQVTGIDEQISSTLFFRLWQVFAGGVLILCIPFWFSGVEQGYYYAFASLLGLQIFFELGMSQVIIQMVGHEYAHIKLDDSGILKGNDSNIARFKKLIYLLSGWYKIAAILFFILISFGGVWFFSVKGELDQKEWIGAWILIVFGTACNLYLSVNLNVLEACGEVTKIARMRTLQSIGGNVLMWFMLEAGAKLWAIPVIPLFSVMYSYVWLRTNNKFIKLVYIDKFSMDENHSISWMKDIFPFQWRIAVSWISGYFIFQLFTPLAFSKIGAVEAGRLGISLSVFGTILTLGMSWVSAKSPEFAALTSQGDRKNLNLLFRSVAIKSIVFTSILCGGVIFLIMALGFIGVIEINRFQSVPVLFCLAVVTISNSLIFAAASYMRAHKEEPMMIQSVVIGLLTLTGAYFGASNSVFLMIFIYAIITVMIALPWTIYLFISYYKK